MLEDLLSKPSDTFFVFLDTCTLPGYMEGVIKECNGLHSMNLEQKGNFAAGWAELQGNDSRFVKVIDDIDVKNEYIQFV